LIIFSVFTATGFSNSQEAFAGQPGNEVTVIKSVDKPIILSGTSVIYSYEVKNTGTNNILVCTTLIDSNSPPGTISSNVAPNGIAPGASVFFQSSPVTINMDTTNTATVTCLGGGEVPLTGTSNQVLVDVVELGSPTIAKSVLKNTVIANQANQVTIVVGGGPLAYENCVVTDPKVGFTSDPFILAANTPAQQTFGPLAYSIATTDTNTATVNCTEPGTMLPVSASDSQTVTVITIGAPTLTKSVLKNTVIANQANQVTIVVGGGPLAYENCVVTDPKVLFTSDPFILAANTPAQQTFGPLAYSIATTDTNTATVNCTEPDTMQPVSASDSQTVTVVALGGLDIMKGVDRTTVTSGDNMVTYNYKVTNNVGFDVINCQIIDSILGAVGAQFNLANGAMTDPLIFSNIKEITQTTMNTATVTCFEPDTMNSVMSPDSNKVTVEFITAPLVSLIKVANPNLIEEGDTVTYTFDATNTGDVVLFDCNIIDDKLGQIGPDNFGLAIGQSQPFQSIVDIFVNTQNSATVTCSTGVDPSEVESTANANVRITVVGGEFLPIDTTALFVSGIQTSAVWILPAVAGLAVTGYYLIRFRNKE